MSGDLVVAIVALVVAVLGIPAAILATRQWGNRRARVDLYLRTTPLLPEGASPGLLQLSYRDLLVDNPHLVEVSLINVGPKDIPSVLFDSGKPITVRFDQTFYGVIGVAGGAKLLLPALGAEAGTPVEVRPSLLKRGESWTFTAVLSGAAKATVEAPLVDTDLRVLDTSGAPVTKVRISALGLTAEFPVPSRTKAV